MRAALVEGGVVVNVIEVESVGAWPGYIESDIASPGDTYDAATGAFTRPPPPPPPVYDLKPEDLTFQEQSPWQSLTA